MHNIVVAQHFHTSTCGHHKCICHSLLFSVSTTNNLLQITITWTVATVSTLVLFSPLFTQLSSLCFKNTNVIPSHCLRLFSNLLLFPNSYCIQQIPAWVVFFPPSSCHQSLLFLLLSQLLPFIKAHALALPFQGLYTCSLLYLQNIFCQFISTVSASDLPFIHGFSDLVSLP